MLRRLATGIAATAVLAVGLLVVPHSRRHNANVASADVYHALNRVRTWRLTGWLLRGDRKIPWEVWGRTAPFFYREQLGDNITFDDGKQRVSVYARNAEGGRGLIIKTAAGGAVPYVMEGLSYANMVKSDCWNGFWKPTDQTDTTATFRVPVGIGEHEVYTVSKETHLPTRYVRQVRDRTHTLEEEHLDAVYNVPLPENVLTPPQVSGYKVVDGGASDAGPRLSSRGVAAANGLKLQARLIAADNEGNLLVRLRTWLGNARIKGSPRNATGLAFAIGYGQARVTGEDEQGRAYISLVTDGLDLPDGDQEMLFVSVEPPAPGRPRPRSFRSTLNISPGVMTERGFQMLFTQPLDAQVDLPAGPTVASIQSALPHWRSLGLTGQVDSTGRNEAPLSAAIDMARYFYYWERWATLHGARVWNAEDKAALLQVTKWLEKSTVQLKPGNNVHADHQVYLADLLTQAGEKEQARKWLDSAEPEAKKYRLKMTLLKIGELRRALKSK